MSKPIGDPAPDSEVPPLLEADSEINTVPEASPPPAADPIVEEPINAALTSTDLEPGEEVTVESGCAQEAEVVDQNTPVPEGQNDVDPIEVSDNTLDEIAFEYEGKKRELQIFVDGVRSFLVDHPDLHRNGECIVHSSKRRLKDVNHLRAKVKRKALKGVAVDRKNLFSAITDLGGVRILHLYQEDFGLIDALIRKKVSDGDWWLNEQPVANTWDPEAKQFFSGFDLEVRQTGTLYTSVHYLVRPRADSPLCCEIQVRTLFEEIWGEVDHQINYPTKTESISLREQLLVLSKITGAGSRLLDAIRRVSDAGT